MFEKKLTALILSAALTGCAALTTTVPQATQATKTPENAESESMECANQVKGFSQASKPSEIGSAKKPTVDLLFWCSKAAEKGDPRSQVVLAGLYERGVGVTASAVEALKWYKAAALQGNLEAQFKVGQIYGRGEGVAVDRNEATRWYLKAAEGGHVEAAYYMGYRCQHGKGTTQNFSEAVRWYAKAADQGNVDAMHGLGVLTLQGQGVPQNQVEAYKWFNLAAVSGQKDYIKSRDRLAKKLSAAQLAEGQRLSSAWAGKHPAMPVLKGP